MRFFRNIILGTAILVILVFAVALFLPEERTVTFEHRSEAPVVILYGLVNTPASWHHWSPWFTRDPQVKMKYHGPESGPGAVMTWQGSRSGEGTLKILDSHPYDRIDLELTFFRTGKAFMQFHFYPGQSGTGMSWSMHSKNLKYPVGLWMGLYYDKIMKPAFETGFSQLDSLALRIADEYRSQ